MFGGIIVYALLLEHLDSTAYSNANLNKTFFNFAALRYIFAGTPNCEVIHGVLYSCLRGLFGISVIGILVSIFSCMLVYQLQR